MQDLRIDLLQEGWNNGGPLARLHIRPLTRAMTRRIEEEIGASKDSSLIEDTLLEFSLSFLNLGI